MSNDLQPANLLIQRTTSPEKKDYIAFSRQHGRVRRAQIIALGLLVLSGAINYMDRTTLAVANPLIRKDLGLSMGDMGLLLSAFLWSYAFAQLPIGALIDRFGPRRLLALGIVVWSIAQTAGGLILGFRQLFATRMLLGIGESPQYPTGARVVRDWFPVRNRGIGAGIFSSSSSVGSAIAPPILTAIMLAFGWRSMFVIMGAAGIITALLWYSFYREPHQAYLSDEERNFLAEGDTTGTASPITFREWRRLFGFRTTWAMMVGFFGSIYLTWLYMSWLPAYLEIERHMSIPHAGWISSLPYIFGLVGGISGGWLVDWLVKHGVGPIASRKYPVVLSLVGMSLCTIFAANAHSTTVAVVFISAAMFLGYVSTASSWALVAVAAPANVTASLGSIQNFGGYLGGALAPTVTGFVAQSTGSFTIAMFIGAAVGLVSATMYFFLLQKPITDVELLAAEQSEL